jgi:hypothetical protein
VAGLVLNYGVSMTLPRRAQMTLGGLGMVLLFGVLGLAWWWWRHRPASEPATWLRRVRAALVAAGLAIIVAGSLGRLYTGFQATPGCTPPGGAQPVRGAHFDGSLLALEVATWPQTGIGLLYSRARDARVCLASSAYYYVGVHADNIAGTKAMTLGDIVLTPGFKSHGRAQLQALIGHEAHHRAQWAIATAIAGPFAYPVAYGIDDFFFPGSHNFFEREAGLEAGSYRDSGAGPVLGPAQWAALGVLAVLVAVALSAVWRRRASGRFRGRADEPGAATDRSVTDGLTRDE